MKKILGKLNFLAVAASGLLYFIIGSLWYSPVLFSKIWTETLDRPFSEISAMTAPMPVLMGSMFLFSLVIPFVLAVLLEALSIKKLSGGILFSLAIGVVFVVMPSLASSLFEAKNLLHFAINYSYPVVGLICAGAILTLWKKKGV